MARSLNVLIIDDVHVAVAVDLERIFEEIPSISIVHVNPLTRGVEKIDLLSDGCHLKKQIEQSDVVLIDGLFYNCSTQSQSRYQGYDYGQAIKDNYPNKKIIFIAGDSTEDDNENELWDLVIPKQDHQGLYDAIFGFYNDLSYV